MRSLSSWNAFFSWSYILPYEHTSRKWSCSHTRKSNITSSLRPSEYQMSCWLLSSQRWWPVALVSSKGFFSSLGSCWLVSLQTAAFYQILSSSSIGVCLTCKFVVSITVWRVLMQTFEVLRCMYHGGCNQCSSISSSEMQCWNLCLFGLCLCVAFGSAKFCTSFFIVFLNPFQIQCWKWTWKQSIFFSSYGCTTGRCGNIS